MDFRVGSSPISRIRRRPEGLLFLRFITKPHQISDGVLHIDVILRHQLLSAIPLLYQIQPYKKGIPSILAFRPYLATVFAYDTFRNGKAEPITS